MKNTDRLKEIIDFVSDRTGADVTCSSRRTDVTDARALYYKIALNTTKASMEVIGSAVGKSHSTVVHTRANVVPRIDQDLFYVDIYRDFISKDTKEKFKGEVSSDTLTDIEIQYRGLSKEDREIYDERASLVLKSFDWKRKDDNRKEVFEIINVSQ